MARTTPILIELPDQIVGDRVTLRPWRDSDAPAFFALVDQSREHLLRWLDWSDSYHSVDDARVFVRHKAGKWMLREDFSMGIFDHHGSLLGSVGLHPNDWRIPSFEIGYWIGAPHEGKGYVAEAVELVTNFAFETLGANRVVIRCDAENERSANVARRCGYVFEGTRRSDYPESDGALRSTMYFSLLPSDRQ